MDTVRGIPWARLTAEAVAIVAGILLAFAIDAWWEERKDRQQALDLMAGLRTDFLASQDHLAVWLDINQRTFAENRAFMQRIRATGLAEVIEVPLAWVISTLSTPTYSPTDANLETAISSGQIELIRSRELRNALATWRRNLEDTREDEQMVRHIAVERIEPVLAAQLRLGGVLDFDTLIGHVSGKLDLRGEEDVILQVTRELEGALAQRMFYARFVVDGLGDIRDSQAEILRMLDELIDRPGN